MYAAVDAGDPVAEGVHAGEFGVGVSHVLEGDFAAVQFVGLGLALGAADFEQIFLRVLPFVQH